MRERTSIRRCNFSGKESVKEIIKNVGALQKHLGSYEDYYAKVGNALGTAVNQYNLAGKEFKKIAIKLGMVGPMRSAGAGPVLKEKLKELASRLGPYPHASLSVPKKVAARLPRPRAKCQKCGFTVPMLKDFLQYGPPICPKDRIEMEAVGDWEL